MSEGRYEVSVQDRLVTLAGARLDRPIADLPVLQPRRDVVAEEDRILPALRATGVQLLLLNPVLLLAQPCPSVEMLGVPLRGIHPLAIRPGVAGAVFARSAEHGRRHVLDAAQLAPSGPVSPGHDVL